MDDGINGELSPRQRDCVVLVAEGMSNKEIAEKLHISAETVKCHLTASYAVLGIEAHQFGARVLAARWWLLEGQWQGDDAGGAGTLAGSV